MAKERRALSGKVVAITGGARGIGKATAAALVRKGCRVAIGDLDLPLAEQTAADLGGGTLALPLDVTDRASFAGFLDEAERQLGPLDVIVNNAGIMPVTPFVEESEESIHRQIDINLHGVIAGTQMAIERMRPAPQRPHRQHRLPGRQGRAARGSPPTAATKHAVVGLSESVRAELRGTGIEMHCVMPTVVNTELTSGVGQRWVKPVEAEDVADAIVDALEVGRYDVWVPKENGAHLQGDDPAAADLARGDRPPDEGRQADDRSRPRRPQRLRGAGRRERPPERTREAAQAAVSDAALEPGRLVGDAVADPGVGADQPLAAGRLRPCAAGWRRGFAGSPCPAPRRGPRPRSAAPGGSSAGRGCGSGCASSLNSVGVRWISSPSRLTECAARSTRRPSSSASPTLYFDYYHRSRTHLSLGKDSPEPRAIQSPEMGSVVVVPQVGELHHRYERRAA